MFWLAKKSLYMKKTLMLSTAYLSIILREPAWGKLLMFFVKCKSSPTENSKWARTAVDKLLTNQKYIPIVGVNAYMNTQFEKSRRCNVDL